MHTTSLLLLLENEVVPTEKRQLIDALWTPLFPNLVELFAVVGVRWESRTCAQGEDLIHRDCL